MTIPTSAEHIATGHFKAAVDKNDQPRFALLAAYDLLASAGDADNARALSDVLRQQGLDGPLLTDEMAMAIYG